MILREKIKAKVDKLDKNDLRIVNLFIDSLNRNKATTPKTPVRSLECPYLQVIKLMGHQSLTSEDINHGREDRF